MKAMVEAMIARAWLAPFFLALLTACPAAEPDPIDRRDCTGDPRAAEFTPGITAESANGLFTVSLDTASPLSPDVGDNVWELNVAITSGTSSIAEPLRVKAWMPDHGHGTRPLWHDSARLPVSGLHRIGPFDLWMPGLWEFTIEATIDGVTDEAKVAFCIADNYVEVPEADAGVAGGDAGSMDAAIPIECHVTAPTACSDPAPTYSDVVPIIARTCLTCHNGLTENWPLTTYEHVADWYSEIRGMMLSCTMPPPDSGIAMSDEEREQLLLWIRCGYRP